MLQFSETQTALVVIVAACLASACQPRRDGGREQLLTFKCAGRYDSGQCAVYGPNVTDLVVRPDAYQNLPVEVRGYLSNEFEDVFLYPDALSYENYRSQYAVRLDIALADRAKFDRFRGEYVQLRGTFTGFALREITQVDELGDRAAPRARVPAPPPLRPEETPKK